MSEVKEAIAQVIIAWLGEFYNNEPGLANNPDYLNEADVRQLVDALFWRARIELK
jgi:hypothetical protein